VAEDVTDLGARVHRRADYASRVTIMKLAMIGVVVIVVSLYSS
jgi:hypothetical protein